MTNRRDCRMDNVIASTDVDTTWYLIGGGLARMVAPDWALERITPRYTWIDVATVHGLVPAYAGDRITLDRHGAVRVVPQLQWLGGAT